MAWTLGDTTLKNPMAFSRQPIEISAEHESITGVLSKDIKKRKERFVLTWRHLTQTQVSEILSEYDKLAVVGFSVSEGDLSIAETQVHITLGKRFYNTPGSEMREDFEIVLTERE